MEMPEGWKRLERRYMRLDAHEYTELIAEAEIALNLCKEMAEALELCTEYFEEIGELHTKHEYYRKKNAALILKKFKEWK